MKLVLVLVDAELELVPGAVDDRMPILDAFYHREVMATLPGASRRGRGDIVHSTLLLCQGSKPNLEGRLKVFVHTRDGIVIEVGRYADVHPNYIRFLQDMAPPLKGRSAPGFKAASMDLGTLVRGIDADLTVTLSPAGEDLVLSDVLGRVGDGTVLAMIGAFPEGDYSSPAYELADVKISLGPKLMRVPDVAARVLESVPAER